MNTRFPFNFKWNEWNEMKKGRKSPNNHFPGSCLVWEVMYPTDPKFLVKKKKLEKSNGKSNNIPKTVFFFPLQPLGVKMYWFDQKIIYQVIIPKYLP